MKPIVPNPQGRLISAERTREILAQAAAGELPYTRCAAPKWRYAYGYASGPVAPLLVHVDARTILLAFVAGDLEDFARLQVVQGELIEAKARA